MNCITREKPEHTIRKTGGFSVKTEKNVCLTAALFLMLAGALFLTPQPAAAEQGLEHLELTTKKNTSIEGVLTAQKQEGDAIDYEITTEPRKGSVTLLEEGRFVYTPREGKKGRDYFGYRSIDAEGNRSEEGTVLIRIENREHPS